MSVTLIVSLLLLVASVAAYRLMGRLSPGDEVPKLLLSVAACICLTCAFFSIPTVLQMGAAGALLALSRLVSLDSWL